MATIPVPVRGTVIASSWGTSVANALNAMYVVGGNTLVTTDSAARASIPFPSAFSVAPAVVVGDASAWGIGSPTALVGYSVFAVSLSTATIYAANISAGVHTPLPNVTVRVMWLAFAVRP